MNEIWKDIEGYEGLYQISNLGNVKSLSRFHWKGVKWWKSKDKILTPRTARQSICYNKNYRGYSVEYIER